MVARDILACFEKSLENNRAFSEFMLVFIKADLHDATLTHATSLPRAYNMTWDHLHAHDFFSYKIKYAKVCARIYGAKVLTDG